MERDIDRVGGSGLSAGDQQRGRTGRFRNLAHENPPLFVRHRTNSNQLCVSLDALTSIIHLDGKGVSRFRASPTLGRFCGFFSGVPIYWTADEVTGIAAFHYRRPSGNRIWRVLSGQRRRTSMMLRADYDELLYPFGTAGARYARGNIPPVLCATLPHLTDDPDSLFDRLAPVVRAHPRQSAAAHYSALFDWLCETLDRRIWIERSGASLLFASTLLREFPNAKIIHLYRDGRETAISMSQHYLFQLIANNLAAFQKLGADPYAAIAHNPKWGQRRDPPPPGFQAFAR